MAIYCLFICPFSMSQGTLELHVLSHVVLGPLSDVTHLTSRKLVFPLGHHLAGVSPRERL